MPNRSDKKVIARKSEEAWINEYINLRPTCERFCAKLKNLIEELLAKESVRYQVVEARAKTPDSFKDKLRRDGKSYEDPLREMTDLCGLRIILYNLNDLDEACRIIDNEFKVDKSKSVDKRNILAVDQFGYLSVHKIVSLSVSRSKLTEWASFKHLKAEIQVRTILQHAWASISHILQYKQESDIPYQFRRKLVRLSGLLELADDQFNSLLTEESNLAREIKARIVNKDKDIPIDALSIREYMEESQLVKDILQLADVGGFHFDSEEPRFVTNLILVCDAIKIKTTNELEQMLVPLKPKTKPFFLKFINTLRKRGFLNINVRPASILALLIVASHKDKFDRPLLQSTLGWHKGVIDALLISRSNFWESNINQKDKKQ